MCDAARQMYKFDRFDYSKVLDLDGDVHDIRKVESDNLDYVLVNYGTCRLKLLLYSELGFKETDEISDFGLIDRWIFLKSNRSLHLLTIANRSCGKGLNNIWKLENDKLTVSLARSSKDHEGTRVFVSNIDFILISSIAYFFYLLHLCFLLSYIFIYRMLIIFLSSFPFIIICNKFNTLLFYVSGLTINYYYYSNCSYHNAISFVSRISVLFYN